MYLFLEEVMMPVKPIFIVQKHQARSLHYDFRLEINGILKSWAIPKGISLHPGEKHLAILTIDHPLEYADFEGIIPEGTYGAGKVLLWDKGTYFSIDDPDQLDQINIENQVEQGKLLFFLEGIKLKGRFALILSDSAHKQWMFMKLNDEEAREEGDILIDQPRSVFSEKTIEEL
jgi:DNA ligase D-like protein (predicted 3'-phosphoesterase)